MTAYEQSIAEGVRQRAEVAESKRQDRWHATYNAAYPYVDAEPYDTVSLRLDNAHEIATRAADRAHGPLAVKAAAVIPPIEHASWKMFADPRVEALVKAARAMLNYTEELEDVPKQFDDALHEALKPFEAKP